MRPFLTIFTTSLFLLSGCDAPPVIEPPSDAALFCDVVADRAWFTQEEIDARQSAGYTRNLAWQYRINTSWDRECAVSETPAR